MLKLIETKKFIFLITKIWSLEWKNWKRKKLPKLNSEDFFSSFSTIEVQKFFGQKLHFKTIFQKNIFVSNWNKKFYCKIKK